MKRASAAKPRALPKKAKYANAYKVAFEADFPWVGKKFAIDEPCILPFARLGALAKALLTIPNSNVAPERTFSTMKKIFTEQRSQLGNSTLSALLKCKLNEDTICTEFTPCGCERTLRLARVACTSYNDLCTSSAQERV